MHGNDKVAIKKSISRGLLGCSGQASLVTWFMVGEATVIESKKLNGVLVHSRSATISDWFGVATGTATAVGDVCLV